MAMEGKEGGISRRIARGFLLIENVIFPSRSRSIDRQSRSAIAIRGRNARSASRSRFARLVEGCARARARGKEAREEQERKERRSSWPASLRTCYSAVCVHACVRARTRASERANERTSERTDVGVPARVRARGYLESG